MEGIVLLVITALLILIIILIDRRRREQIVEAEDEESIQIDFTDVVEDIFWNLNDREKSRIKTDEESIMFFNAPLGSNVPNWYSKYVKNIYEFLELEDVMQLYILKIHLKECAKYNDRICHHSSSRALSEISENEEYLRMIIIKLSEYWISS